MKFFSSKIAITLNVVAALVLLLNGGGGSGGGGGGKQGDEIRPSASAIASPPPLRGSTYGNNKKATEGDDGPHPHLVLSSIIGGGSCSDSGGLSATAASSPEYLSLVGGSKEDTNEDGVGDGRSATALVVKHTASNETSLMTSPLQGRVMKDEQEQAKQNTTASTVVLPAQKWQNGKEQPQHQEDYPWATSLSKKVVRRLLQAVPAWFQRGGDIENEEVSTNEPTTASPSNATNNEPTNATPSDAANNEEPTTASPSDAPTEEPTSASPSDAPTDEPTTASPSDAPTNEPTQPAWIQLGVDIDGEASGDFFGFAVSLSSDGSVLAVGSYEHNIVGDGNSTNPRDNCGYVRVYKYLNNSWTQLGADIDGEDAADWSGWSISLSSDGSVLAVGATDNDGSSGSTSENPGHVRVYKYNVSSNAWTQLGADIDGEAAGDWSGWSISLSSDGSVLAVGAVLNDGSSSSGYNSGHVRVYQYNVSFNSWAQLGADIDGEAADDWSGWSVSLSGDGSVLAVGGVYSDGSSSATTDDRDRGHVRVYQYNVSNSTWTQRGADIDGEAAGDNSGWAVSLSSDGIVLAVGAICNDGSSGSTSDNRGHVRVYKYNVSENTWTQLGADIDGEASGADYSGYSVSLSSDGSVLAVGATDDADCTKGTASDNPGRVRVYHYNGSDNTWTQRGANIDGESAGDFSGSAVSLSSDGSVLAVGAIHNDGSSGSTSDNRGHVRIFQERSTASLPSTSPSDVPTDKPTTASPSDAPTDEPTTASPSDAPTDEPTTASPSDAPTVEPTTASPSDAPTDEPTAASPSGAPTDEPTTASPSDAPTDEPTTASPSDAPTDKPTTASPSDAPTDEPTMASPSDAPTVEPTTASPSDAPTDEPTTASPTDAPTDEPTTASPSDAPTDKPTTASPSDAPTDKPTTASPSDAPTDEPTMASPSDAPTDEPTTASPSDAPTHEPTTASPSDAPTDEPTTASPSGAPTDEPTTASLSDAPTDEPTTASPSDAPTDEPTTASPSDAPTDEPTTASPSDAPTDEPTTASPSDDPTGASTSKPTAAPTNKPTAIPTISPTATPTNKPTAAPTNKLTAAPTLNPTDPPTNKPTAVPTNNPTAILTNKPTATPTNSPTGASTSKPTAVPTNNPTATPTNKPTATPTSVSTNKPTAIPTISPTATPTNKPTAAPTNKLTAAPTLNPTAPPTNIEFHEDSVGMSIVALTPICEELGLIN
ncbi:hypothetical protein ACHAWU_006248 [Discostella pseudostelligera]|uniref:Uncharacterized protein n=1 Tax=Discostella pseudostelligera TaxID=259834 RepID=A0ABD3MLY1_9STRA